MARARSQDQGRRRRKGSALFENWRASELIWFAQGLSIIARAIRSYSSMRAFRKFIAQSAAVSLLVCQASADVPQVKVVANGESKTNADACRGILVGPGINQPD